MTVPQERLDARKDTVHDLTATRLDAIISLFVQSAYIWSNTFFGGNNVLPRRVTCSVHNRTLTLRFSV